MNISPFLAQKIVNNLKATLNHEINFIDNRAMIIASSDNTRLNDFHGGAAHVMQIKKPLFIEYDGQYEQTKKGINLPIYFENEIIGVVGVTGGIEVKKYAEIVKAMTEILIKEAYMNAISFQNREKHRHIIETLLLTPEKLVEEKLFDLDFSSPYTMIVAKSQDNQDLSLLFPFIENLLAAYPRVFFTINYAYLLVLTPRSELDLFCQNIQKEVWKKQNITLHFGIGLTSFVKEDVQKSFETAKQALYWTYQKNQKATIAHFRQMDMGMIISTIPKSSKKLFLSNVFKDLQEKEVDWILSLLKVFAKHNGKLSVIADELFIHKNTLQYQLNKIRKLTGYDPRDYHDFSILNIALLLHEEEEIMFRGASYE